MKNSRSAFSSVKLLSNLLFVLSLVFTCQVAASGQVTRTYGSHTLVIKTKTIVELPEATEPCTPAECDWWNQLRQAANELQRKEDGKSKRKFAELLAEGLRKSYRVPLKDSPPKVLASRFPDISDVMKYRKVYGELELSVEYKADGSIGEIKVIKPLNSQIDNRVIKAARQHMFLPTIKDGAFVTEWQKGGITISGAR